MRGKLVKVLRRHAALSDAKLPDLIKWHNSLPRNKRQNAIQNLQLINQRILGERAKPKATTVGGAHAI